MAITYNAGTNIITVTGYTSGTPCTFLDVYNADVAGAWGVVTRQCTNQYCFDCKIIIGDGSTATHFTDVGVDFSFIHGILSANWEYLLRVRTNSYFTIRACTCKVMEHLYEPFFGGISTEYAPNFKMEDCTFYGLLQTATNAYPSTAFRYLDNTGYFKRCTLYNVYLSVVDVEIYRLSMKSPDIPISRGLNVCSGTMNDILITDIKEVICLYQAFGGTFKNVTTKDITSYEIRPYAITVDCYLINKNFENMRINWIGSNTAVLWEQYEFDLKVVDKDNAAINGATVKIWDKDNTLIVDTTTNISGVIATQTITRGYYNQANGNTLQDASPHTIEIKKSGTNYLTYKTDFTLDDKKNWVIMMTDVSDIVTGINDLKGTGFVKDTDSMVNTVDNIWNEVLTGATHNIATSAGRRLREAADVMVLREEETAQGGSLSSITLNAAASSVDGFYDMSTLLIISGSGAGQARTFTDYNGTTKLGVPCEDWLVAPDNTSKYIIRGHACCSVYQMNESVYTKIWDQVKKLFPFLF